jgi:RimJ/RimL family protein N-acetyltransferase
MGELIMLDKSKLHFRKVQATDFPLIHQWLNTSYVAQWWSPEPVSLEKVSEAYRAYLEGSDPIQPFLIMYENLPIGQIQTYKLRDYPEWHHIVAPTEESAGVDIFIGHPDYIDRGLGNIILRKFIGEVVFAQQDIEGCIIDPDPANKRAIRSYEKAGFRYWKTTLGGETPDTVSYIMRLSKAEFLAGEAG